MVIIQNKIPRHHNISQKIIDKLRIRNKRIFSKEEILKVIIEYGEIYKKKVNLISLWTYLRKGKYIKRILGDYYYIYSLEERYNHYCLYSEEELVFLILEKMEVRWYLGLERALIENKIGWQILNFIPIINDHFSGIKKVGNSTLKFIKTKENRFKFGLIEKRTNNNVKYDYSDLEKTYLDFLYFYSYEGKDVKLVRKSLKFKIKKKKLAKYAKNYSKKIRGFI